MESRQRKPNLEQPHKPQRVLACVLCQQRKVKCDRKFPCGNCVKLQVDCIPVSQPRPRRRRFPERELLGRLRGYEDLLRRNGIDFQPLHKNPEERSQDGRDGTDDDQQELSDIGSPATSAGPTGSHKSNTIWHAMGHGLRDPSYDDMRGTLVQNAWTQSFPNDNPVLFGAQSQAMNISELHPEPFQIVRMWQIYLNNVDPLMKVTHTHSLQPRILDAASNMSNAVPTLQALMLSIYCTSILSLTADECHAIFGVTKEELLSKYQSGCQQALLNCGFLRSENRESLTALYLLLVSMYPGTDPRSLSSMLSIAIRIAQRIGMDDESSNRRHTIFEAEMRRRLWWSLMLFDTRIGELAEFKPGSLIPTWSCSTPLNLNDSDLRTEMKDSPLQGQVTEAIFVVVRGQLGDFLRHAHFHLDFTNPTLKPITKDVTDLIITEKRIEDDLLSSCDEENALHFTTMWAARGQISKCHLMRHYSKYSSSAAYQTHAHRDRIMFHALRMLECDTKIITSPLTKGYLWLFQCYFPLPAYIFLVQELQVRPIDEEFDRVWEVMGDNCKARFLGPGLVHTPAFRMFAKIIIQAWDDIEKIHKVSDRPLIQPSIVSSMKREMTQTIQSEADRPVGTRKTMPPTSMNDFSTQPEFLLGAENWMIETGGPTGIAEPDQGLFPTTNQSPSTAEMNHFNWVSMVWGLHQGWGW